MTHAQAPEQYSSRAQQIIFRELNKVQGYKKRSNGSVWICCKFHGPEIHPSLSVNIDPTNTRAKLGQGYCFGCSKSYQWNTIATKYGLETIKELDFKQTRMTTRNKEEMRNKLLAHEDSDIDKTLRGFGAQLWQEFPESMTWRGIRGRIMSLIGGYLVVDNFSDDHAVVLPTYVNGELVGPNSLTQFSE